MGFEQLLIAFIGFAIAWILAYPVYSWFWGRRKLSEQKSVIESYRYEIDILNDHYEKLRLEKAEQDKEYSELQNEVESVSASLEKRQIMLVQRENELRKFNAQSSEVEGKSESLRQEVYRKTEQIDLLHRQIQQKTSQVEHYEQELSKQKLLVAQLQLQGGDVTNNPVLIEKNRQIANLHTQLSAQLSLESQVLTQSNEINELRIQKQQLQEIVHEKDKSLLQLNEEVEQIGALINENANIRNENDKYAEKLRTLETHLEELKKQSTRIEKTSVESAQSANIIENDLTGHNIDINEEMARKKIIKQDIIIEKESTNIPVNDKKLATKNTDELEVKSVVEAVKTVETIKEIEPFVATESETIVNNAEKVDVSENIIEPAVLADENTESKVKIDEIDEESEKRKTPIFKLLADPKLPEIDKGNQLYLQMQSPKRIFFFWSVKSNAYKTLQKAFGENANGYMLVAKLQNLSNKTEDIFPIDVEGSAWFDVPDNTKFQTEIGFFSPSQPFVRVAYSNTLETPRMSPSPNVDNSPVWNISTMQFAEVLDASGYSQDAFEVAMQVENSEDSIKATEVIYSRITGESEEKFAQFDMGELRSVLLGIVSGIPLAVILEKVSGELSAWLSENPQVFEPQNVMTILQETFGEDFGKFVEGTKTQTAGVVFGASSINFPKAKFAGSSR